MNKRKFELVRFEEEEGDILIDTGELDFEEWKRLYFIIKHYLDHKITNELRVQIWEEEK